MYWARPKRLQIVAWTLGEATRGTETWFRGGRPGIPSRNELKKAAFRAPLSFEGR